MSTSTSFLNVDFEIWSDTHMADLVDSLKPEMTPLHLDCRSATLELSDDPSDIDDAILKFYSVISCRKHALQYWTVCKKRQANVGIQSGSDPHQLIMLVSNDSIKILQELDMNLAITIYALDMRAYKLGSEPSTTAGSRASAYSEAKKGWQRGLGGSHDPIRTSSSSASHSPSSSCLS